MSLKPNSQPMSNLISTGSRGIRFVLLITTVLAFLSFVPFNASLTEEILVHTNKFRRSKGLRALEMRDDLNAIARKHSEDMARGRRAFGHGGYQQREKQVQKIFQGCSMAENVAYGSTSGRDVVTEWKNSSGHRRNMLGNYSYIGIGTARDRQGRLYFTQIFVR